MNVLEKMFSTRRVIVCAGAGGAGKTTIAAALGVFAARLGKRAIVVTIDPARRLKDSLGLRELHNTPKVIALDAPGHLSAMMLEQKPAWDALITAHAPTAVVRDRLLSNRFYRRFASELAGAHAYAAVDVLCTLSEREAFDVVIVDTPPIRHAVELFRAPAKVLGLLEEGALPRALKIYEKLEPGRIASWFLRRLETAVGTAALADAAEFLTALAEMIDVFIARANAMQVLLESDRLGCVLIATPDRRAWNEAERFLAETRELGIRTDLLVLNRSALGALDGIDEEDRTIRAELAAHLDPAALDFVLENLDRYRGRARIERAQIEQLGLVHVALPELKADVHDLSGLIEVGARLDRVTPGRPAAKSASSPARAPSAGGRSPEAF
jgi:anion-transporting  ArsA/GET3 family ATPase